MAAQFRRPADGEAHDRRGRDRARWCQRPGAAGTRGRFHPASLRSDGYERGPALALVVANDQYADPGLRRLAAPAQDAAALAEVLGSVGRRVRGPRPAQRSAQEIRFAVEDFFADRAPEDLLLLHFSCHGLKNAAGELFLAAADTRPTRLASTAMAADFVNRQMADSRAQRIALFLDCCYGGAFPRGMVVRASGEAQVRDAFAGQEQIGGGRGRVIVTASSAMEYAFEGGELTADAPTPAPSVFTSAVVDGLTTGEADKDGDGWVGLTELVGYVTDRVHRVTPNQNPQMWTFGSQGELLIARSRIRRITPAPLAPELSRRWRVRCQRQGSASSTTCASAWRQRPRAGVRRLFRRCTGWSTTTAARSRMPRGSGWRKPFREPPATCSTYGWTIRAVP